MSIPLIVFGSTLLGMKVMESLPDHHHAGAALLGFLAGEMFVTDPADKDFFDKLTDSAHVGGSAGAITVVAIGLYARRHHAAQDGGQHATKNAIDQPDGMIDRRRSLCSW